MNRNRQAMNDDEPSRVDNSAQKKRGYEAPRLHEYGDVRDLTFGPTVGFNESGSGGTFRDPDLP